MNVIKYILTLILLLFSCVYWSQEIANVDFTVKDNKIIVNYDLVNCGLKQAVDVNLVVTCNGKVTTPPSITGDVRNVACGHHKQIEWNVLDDQNELKGSLQVAVNIVKTHSTRITGGPSNAFLSMLLPGVGDYFVNRSSKGWYYVSLLYLGSAYFAFSSKIESNKFYDQYHVATTQTDMDNAYEKANSDYQLYQFMLGAAATIWICDVVYVAVKGFKNRKKQLNNYTMKEPKVKFSLSLAPANFRVGIIKKF